MIRQLANLNWISVLVAFGVYSVLGYLWFTVLFAKQYKISLGRANETLPHKALFIVGPAVCTLVNIIASAILIYALNISSYSDTLAFAALIGFGYLVANTVNIAINPNIPRPIYYGIITGGYHLVGILVASSILVVMR